MSDDELAGLIIIVANAFALYRMLRWLARKFNHDCPHRSYRKE